jgi:hypothetical protein
MTVMILIPCCCSCLRKMRTWRPGTELSCGREQMKLSQLGHSVLTEPRLPSSDLIVVRNRIFRKQPEQFSGGHSVSAPIQALKLTCSARPVLIFVRLQASALPQALKRTCSVQPVLIFVRLQASALPQALILTCSGQMIALISETLLASVPLPVLVLLLFWKLSCPELLVKSSVELICVLLYFLNYFCSEPIVPVFEMKLISVPIRSWWRWMPVSLQSC